MSRPKRPRRLWPYVTGAAVLGLGLFFLGFYLRELWWHHFLPYYYWLHNLLSDKEKIRALVKSWGAWGPLLYILLQAGQVIFAPLPGETTGGLMSGFLFGAGLGVVYSLIGLVLGSAIAFLLGRWLEEHVVTRWVSPPVMERFRFIMERQGALISLLLFALPYFPKDYVCIILGLSGMPLRVFLVVVTVGRFPATLLFNLQGAQLYAGNYSSFFILVGVFAVLAVILFFLRDTLYRWLVCLGEGPGKEVSKKG